MANEGRLGVHDGKAGVAAPPETAITLRRPIQTILTTEEERPEPEDDDE